MIAGYTSRLNHAYCRLVNSWMTAAAIVLLAFAFAAERLDDYPIYVDGLFSMATSGFFDESTDIIAVLDRLVAKSQQHVPSYFLTLFFWGNLVDWTPLALRLLSVFFGILSLALVYRLGRHFMNKEAGLLAQVMLASLAFYNIWYLPIRMYTMFVAAALLVLWLYARLLRRPRATRIDLALLWLATVGFVYTHIFSLAMLCGIGVYHLLFVSKTRKWFAISGAFMLAAVVFLPWLGVLFQGTAYATGRAEVIIEAQSAGQLLWNITGFGNNLRPEFLVLFLFAAVKALRRDTSAIALWVLLVVTLAFYVIVNKVFGVIDYGRLRYLVIVLPLMILLMVKGLELLSRWKLVIVIIIFYWIASGWFHQDRIRPGQFVRSYDTIPIHLIERHLRDEFREGDLITGWTDGLNLYFESVVYGGIADFYFGDYGIEVAIEHTYQLEQLDPDEIVARLVEKLEGRDRVWLVYDHAHRDNFRQLWNDVLDARYFRCYIDDQLESVRIVLYKTSDCE